MDELLVLVRGDLLPGSVFENGENVRALRIGVGRMRVQKQLRGVWLVDCWRLFDLLGLLCFKHREWFGAGFDQDVDELRLFCVLLRLHNQRNAFLVFLMYFNASLDQQLQVSFLAFLNRVKGGGLQVVINVIVVRALFQQKVNELNVALTNSIEERCLSVSIKVINITAVLHKQLGKFYPAISTHIEKRGLAERVHVVCFCAHLEELKGPLVGGFIIFYLAGEEDDVLSEGLVDELVDMSLLGL